jgi:small subunit ribosomal protein S8
MAINDTLANAMSKILHYEITGKRQVSIYPTSKVIRRILDILNNNNYLGKYESSKTSKGETLDLNLLGKINKCGVIKPRFNVKKSDFEKFEKRFLPAKNFGLIIVSTSKGMMTHNEAKEEGVGGKLVAFVY